MIDHWMRVTLAPLFGLVVFGMCADRALSAPVSLRSAASLEARRPTLAPRAARRPTAPAISQAARRQAGLLASTGSRIRTPAAQSTLRKPTPNAATQLAQAQATAAPLNGLLPDTPYYNYLRWRRSLNPARFDYYHPGLGPQLGRDDEVRNPPPPVIPQPGPTPTPPVEPIPQVILPPEIPTVNPPGIPGDNGGGQGPPGPTPYSPPIPLNPPSPSGNGVVPEPSAVALLLMGLAFAPRLLRKQKSRSRGPVAR